MGLVFDSKQPALTGIGVPDVALRETAESEVETLVNVPDVLLEVLADLGELRE